MAAKTSRKVDDDLANVEFETSEDVEVIPTFDSMGLREDLLRGIYAYGFEKPSAIQQRAIKPIVKGRDVIAQAQSGTGKTATFSCAILQSIDTTVRETQVKHFTFTDAWWLIVNRTCQHVGIKYYLLNY